MIFVFAFESLSFCLYYFLLFELLTKFLSIHLSFRTKLGLIYITHPSLLIARCRKFENKNLKNLQKIFIQKFVT